LEKLRSRHQPVLKSQSCERLTMHVCFFCPHQLSDRGVDNPTLVSFASPQKSPTSASTNSLLPQNKTPARLAPASTHREICSPACPLRAHCRREAQWKQTKKPNPCPEHPLPRPNHQPSAIRPHGSLPSPPPIAGVPVRGRRGGHARSLVCLGGNH
jgi:hypothetical protein